MKGAFYTAKYDKHGKLIPRVAKTNNRSQRNVAGESSSSNTNNNNNVTNKAESSTSGNTSNNDTNNNIRNTAEKVEPNRALTLEDNYCVIYVWVPKADGKHLGSTSSLVAAGGNAVGHVSIETKDFYGSYWPKWEVEAQGKREVKGRAIVAGDGCLVANYVQDTINEGNSETGETREAEFKIVLYSLDVDNMYKAFEKFKNRQGPYSWSLTGRGMFASIIGQNSAHSCASFVYDLLYHGDLFRRLNYNMDLARDIFIVNPNNMLKLVTNAKHDELSKYPQTKNYKKPFDEIISAPTLKQIEPEVKAGGYCSVM